MWTDAERKFLVNNADTLTAKELSTAFLRIFGSRKTVDAIRSMAKGMGVRPKLEERNSWSEAELEYLYKNRNKKTSELAKHLPGRTEKAIKSKIHHEGFKFGGRLKRMTPWMESMLEPVSKTGKSIYDMAIELHQSGRRVQIESNRRQEMALYCREYERRQNV